MEMHYLLFLTLLSSLLIRARADDGANDFLYPTASGPPLQYVGNELWTLGDVQRVQWMTNLSSYKMELWQQGIDPGFGYRLTTVYTYDSKTAQSGVQYFDWTAQLYSSNLTFSPIYFFWINPNTDTAFSSHYFNMTEKASVSNAALTATASATPSTRTATSTSGQSTYATSTSPSSTTTSKAGEKDESQLPLQIGLGVGLGIGVTLLVLMAVLVGMKIRSRWRSTPSNATPHYPWIEPEHSQHAKYAAPPHYEVPAQEQKYAYEVEGSQRSPVEIGIRD